MAINIFFCFQYKKLNYHIHWMNLVQMTKNEKRSDATKIKILVGWKKEEEKNSRDFLWIIKISDEILYNGKNGQKTGYNEKRKYE